MKTCSKCKGKKPLNLFQVRNASKDGFTARCKQCLKAYDDSRLRDPKRMKARIEYQKTEKGRLAHAKANTKWLEKNKKKRSVHVITGNAIRDGKLTKKPCEACGVNKVNAHHEDYDEPLMVKWLCDLCHKEWHAIHGEGRNAN